MFKILVYYNAYDRLIEMVTMMKKIGIDVASHQTPNQVLSQTIEFNADFIVFETGKDIDAIFAISEKLQHLLTPPKIILVKKEDEILSSNKVMKANISKVLSEPIELNELIAYTLESKGYDPIEYFSKYLEMDYTPKKTITKSKVLKVDKKFTERDYLNSFSSILDDIESDSTKSLASDKIDEFKKNAVSVDLSETADSDRDRFMQALLMGQPTD